MPLPVLPTAADELEKAELLRLPTPPSLILLVSRGSVPEDDTGKPVEREGVDPNLKMEAVELEVEDDTNGVEELQLFDAVMAAALVVIMEPADAKALLVLVLLAARDELLNIF